jgi:hypothetical protein
MSPSWRTIFRPVPLIHSIPIYYNRFMIRREPLAAGSGMSLDEIMQIAGEI